MNFRILLSSCGEALILKILFKDLAKWRDHTAPSYLKLQILKLPDVRAIYLYEVNA